MKFLSRLDDFEHIVIDGSVSGTGLSSLYLKDTATPILRIGNNNGDSFITYDGSELSISSDVDLRLTTPTDQDVFLITSTGNITTTQAGGIFTIGGGLTLPAITGGFLKTDANGVVSVDNSSFLTNETDTLDSVTDRGNTTTNDIGVGAITLSQSSSISGAMLTHYTNNYVYLRGGTEGAILSDNSANNTIQVSGAGNYIRFETGNGAERMRINSSGNVGIGTTSPGEKLDVVGNIKSQYNGNNYSRLGQNSSGGYIQAYSGAVEKIMFRSYGDSFINGGNVGIGITSPGAKLDVNGGIRSEGPDGGMVMRSWQAGASYGMIGTSNMGSQEYALITDGTDTLIGGGAGGYTYIRSGNNDSNPQLVINGTNSYFDGGNVGIGTTSPTHLLTLETASSPGLKIKDTTQGATLLAFSQDSNSHVGTFSSHPLVFDTNSTERMRITSAGNVGIGTTAPNGQLAIKSGTNSDLEFFSEASGSAIQSYNRTTSTWGYLRFLAGGGEKMRIHSDGNVGIGTTNPSAVLDISGSSSSDGREFLVHGGSSGHSLEIVDRSGYTTSTANVYIQDADNLNTRASLHIKGNNGAVESLWVSSTGRTGIGTASPSEKLHVVGNVRIEGDLTVNGSYTQIDTDVNTTEQWNVTNDGTGPAVTINQTGAQDIMDVQDDGTSVFYIEDGGNIGIGTTDPTNNLEVSNSNSGGIGATLGIYNPGYNANSSSTINIGRASDSNWEIKSESNADGGRDYDLIFSERDKDDTAHEEYLRLKSTGALKISSYGSNSFTGTAAYALAVDSSGNVIETSYIPSSSSTDFVAVAGDTMTGGLNIEVSTSNTQLKLKRTTSATGEFNIYTNTDSLFFHNVGQSTYPMMINSSGNVGIGTTDPSEKLHVVGNALISGGTGDATLTIEADTDNVSETDNPNILFKQDGGLVTGDIGFEGDADALFVGSLANSFYMVVDNSTPLQLGTNNAARLTINGGDGNVGIGTNSPGRKLHVSAGNGDVAAKFENTSSNGTVLHLQTTGDGKSMYFQTDHIYVSSGAMHFGNDTGDLYLKPGSSSGVGINTTNPTGLFNSYISAARQITHNGNGGDLSVISDNNSSPVFYVKGTGTADLVNVFDNTTEVFTIKDGGNVGIGTDSPSKKLHVNGSYKLGTNAYIEYGGVYPYTITTANTASVGNLVFSAGFGSAGYESRIDLQGTNVGNNAGITLSTASSARLVVTNAGNVGIDNTAPSNTLTVGANLSNTSSFNHDSLIENLMVRGAGSAPANLWLHKDDQTIFDTNDLGSIKFSGHNGTDSVNGGRIWYEATEDWSGSTNSTRFSVSVVDGTTSTTGLVIESDGAIQLPQYTAGYLKSDASGNVSLDTSTYLTSVAFSDLTSTPTTIAGYGITDALEIGTTATTALAGNTAIPVSGTDFDPAGTDNSTDVTLDTSSYDYLSISGQEITLGQIDYNADITNLPTLGTAAATASTDYATAAQGTKADNALPKSGGTMTGHIAMEEDHLINYRFDMIDNVSPQYILLCRNASENDVNGVIRMDRTSGNWQAASVEVIVSSGSNAAPKAGALRTLQVEQQTEEYTLVTVTHGGNDWIAIKYTGNTYPETSGAYFTGRLKSTGTFLTVVSTGITNETAWGGSNLSKSYLEVGDFIISANVTLESFGAGYLKTNVDGVISNTTTIPWSTVSSTPTTISGYGITDALQIGTTATTALAGNTSIPVSGTDFDPVGTDNSTDVTLASVTSNYLSISGQEITAGTVPIALGGTGATTAANARTNLGVDAAGTDNSTDVTLVTTSHDYLSLSGQAITLGAINLDDINGGATAGILTTNTSGVVSVDTTTYSTFSGSYTDLTNKPTLFDGAYSSLTGVPTLGTAAASAATDFVAVTGDTMTGDLTIANSNQALIPLILGSTSQTTYTLQSFKTSSHTALSAYIIAYGASHVSEAGNFAIKNTLSGKSIFFEVDNAVPLRLKNTESIFTGNLGIGITNPLRRLDVDSASASDIARFGNNSGNFTLGQTTNLTSLDLAASNAYRIRQGSTVPFYVKSDGNVGIGTTGPIDKLQVNGSLFVTGKIYNGSTNDSAGITFPGSSTRIDGFNGITFHASSTNVGSQSERMRITSGGNVGIGTTNPGSKLHVKSGRINITAASSGQYDLIRLEDNAGSAYGAIGINTAGFMYLSNTTSGTEHFVLNSSGNVGIGTTNPATKLHVVGTAETRLRVGSSNASSNVVLELRDENTPTGQGTVITYNNATGETYFNNAMSTATTDFHFQSGEYGTANDFFTLSNSGGNSILHLKTTSGDSFITYEDSTNELAVASDGDLRLTTPTDQDVFFISSGGNIDMTQAGGTVDMGGNLVVDGDGDFNSKVVIGTATVATPNAAADDLHIKSSGSNGITISSGNAHTGTIFFGDGVSSVAAGFRYNHNTGDMAISAEDNITFACDNVGIGITNPSNKLTIASGTGGGTAPDSRTQLYIDKDGEAYISINSPANSFNGLRLSIAGAVKASMELYDNTTQGKKLQIGTVDTRDLVFATTNAEKMRITSGGNVGIGTDNPSYKLTVSSGTEDIGIVTASSDSGSYVGFLDNATSTIPKVGAVGNKLILDASQYVGVRKTNPSYALDVNGTIRATGDVIAYSDARVKENVETIPNALDKVKAMRGVGYNKIGEEKRSIGVIAQEMLEVMPEVVSQDEQGMYSVAYGNLVGVLIEAVKDLESKVEQLQNKIDGIAK